MAACLCRPLLLAAAGATLTSAEGRWQAAVAAGRALCPGTVWWAPCSPVGAEGELCDGRGQGPVGRECSRQPVAVEIGHLQACTRAGGGGAWATDGSRHQVEESWLVRARPGCANRRPRTEVLQRAGPLGLGRAGRPLGHARTYIRAHPPFIGTCPRKTACEIPGGRPTFRQLPAGRDGAREQVIVDGDVQERGWQAPRRAYGAGQGVDSCTHGAGLGLLALGGMNAAAPPSPSARQLQPR